jgi:hypothetical protein
MREAHGFPYERIITLYYEKQDMKYNAYKGLCRIPSSCVSREKDLIFKESEWNYFSFLLSLSCKNRKSVFFTMAAVLYSCYPFDVSLVSFHFCVSFTIGVLIVMILPSNLYKFRMSLCIQIFQNNFFLSFF